MISPDEIRGTYDTIRRYVRRTPLVQLPRGLASQDRTLLIEHPVNHSFKLTGEKPQETAADVYRFRLKVPAGDSKSLTVTEEREDQAEGVFVRARLPRRELRRFARYLVAEARSEQAQRAR